MVEPLVTASRAADAPAAEHRVRHQRVATVSHRVEYGALRLMIGALGTMTWPHAVAMGARFGALGYRPFGIRRASWSGRSPRPSRTRRAECGASPARLRAPRAHRSRRRSCPAFPRGGARAVRGGADVGRRGALRARARVLMCRAPRQLGAGRRVHRGARHSARGVARRMGNPLFDAYLTGTRSRAWG